MSGTSLDGLDCCYVEFQASGDSYIYSNLITKSIPYQANWKQKLKNAFFSSPKELEEVDKEYGKFLGEQVNAFIAEKKLSGKIDVIASHGHTIFHQPLNGITVQIGSGEEILKSTHINVINDFRITDVKLGGQGAPLVPVGDHFLFSDFEACLNLGGFSNISLIDNKERIAFDVSPCNLPINLLMQQEFRLDYDNKGEKAKAGKISKSLFADLNGLSFYTQSHPKSLGVEWLNQNFMPIVAKHDQLKIEDILNTVTEHIAFQIAQVLNKFELKNVLITGGGVFNDFLIQRLKSQTSTKIIIPEPELVEFKEAIVFAFLGYLNLKNKINTLKSVTGALDDSIGGIRHFFH